MLAKVKPYLYGALGLLVLLLSLGIWYLNSEVTSLQSDIVIKDGQIEDLSKTAKVITGSGKITETTNVELHNGVEKRIKEQSVIQEEVQSEVTKINEDFRLREPEADTSAKEALEQERAKAVSKARISGLWKQYCSTQTDPAQCFASASGENK